MKLSGTRTCPDTRKACYPNRSAAEHVRHRAERRLGEELRVYGCPGCGFFHLTSKINRPGRRAG